MVPRQDPEEIRYYRGRVGEEERRETRGTTLERRKGEQWASVEDATITASPERAKLDDNLAFTVSFKLNGGIRRNFVRRLWEVAYDEHDLGLRIAYRVDLSKLRSKLLLPSEL